MKTNQASSSKWKMKGIFIKFMLVALDSSTRMGFPLLFL